MNQSQKIKDYQYQIKDLKKIIQGYRNDLILLRKEIEQYIDMERINNKIEGERLIECVMQEVKWEILIGILNQEYQIDGELLVFEEEKRQIDSEKSAKNV